MSKSEEPKDKRTKAYKEWKANFDKENSVGLGDVIEKVTTATGIKKAVDHFTKGKDCGCQKRKEKLNSKYRFSYNRNNVRCFTEDQYNKWTELKKRTQKTLSEDDIKFIIELGIQLFAQDNTRQIKGCNSCLKYLIIDINRVYDGY